MPSLWGHLLAPGAGEAYPARPAAGRWETALLLAFIFALLFDPNFSDGRFDHAETGLYLGNIFAILHGKVPYRDIFLQFGPLNDYLPALTLRLAGPSLYALRAYFFFAGLATVLVAWLLARQVLGSRPFIYLAAFLLAYETFNPNWVIYWGGARFIGGLLVVGALMAFAQGRRPGLALFMAGGLAAFCLQNSIEVGLFAGAAGLLTVLAQGLYQRAPLARVGRHLLLLASGWILVMLPLVLYFAGQGALAEYLRIAFYDVPVNHGAKFGQMVLFKAGLPEATWRAILPWLWSGQAKMFVPAMVFALAAYICLSAWRRRVMGLYHWRIFILLVYGLPIYLITFRQFGGPQSQCGLAPAIILGLMLLERVYLYWRAPTPEPADAGAGQPGAAQRRRAAAVLVLALVYLLGSKNMPNGDLANFARAKIQKYGLWGGHAPGLVPLDLPGAGGVWIDKKEARELTDTAAFITKHTQPGEAIIVTPESGALYFLAGRPNLLRFSTPAMAYTAPRFQAEITRQLAQDPPRLIVKRNKRSGHAKHAGKSDYELLPSFYDLIAAHYTKITSFGAMDILLHNKARLDQSGWRP